MIHETSADLPTPWPEAIADAHGLAARLHRPSPRLAGRARCQARGRSRRRAPAGHAPGEGEHDEAQRIEAQRADLAVQAAVGLSRV